MKTTKKQVPIDARQVVGYVRVSTKRQAGDGLSLDAQAERIRALATLHDLPLADIVVDAESGTTLRRPAFAQLLARIDAGLVSVVIVAKLDRLTRSVRDLAELLDRFERRDVTLMSVAESLDTRSAAGRLVLNVLMSVAQWEAEAIGERTREVLAHKRDLGQRISRHVPLGYALGANGRDLVPNAEERRLMARAKKLRASGRTLAGIAETLNAAGLRTRRGTPWGPVTIFGLLKAEKARRAERAA